ncbi:cytochrome oxidase small assembly protein [Massilia rhizosphaerae]|nr:cytochrome oxidase small assembly protein [Massilia rhizosphaerae]
MNPTDRSQQMRKANLRTALWLAGLALFFFVALFVKHLWLN